MLLLPLGARLSVLSQIPSFTPHNSRKIGGKYQVWDKIFKRYAAAWPTTFRYSCPNCWSISRVKTVILLHATKINALNQCILTNRPVFSRTVPIFTAMSRYTSLLSRYFVDRVPTHSFNEKHIMLELEIWLTWPGTWQNDQLSTYTCTCSAV